MAWQLQDAKARFSEFLNAAIKKGPQVVTRRGVETDCSGANRRVESIAKSRASHFKGAVTGTRASV